MINFPKVSKFWEVFLEVFNKPMSDGKPAQVEVQLIEDLLVSPTHLQTTTNVYIAL